MTGGGRDLTRARRLMPDIRWVAVDFNRDTDPQVWRQRLAGYDAVVNAVGVLQSGLRDKSHRVHVEATGAFFRGAALAGVGRAVHISALGADAAGKTAFARDKAAADAALAEIGDLDVVILRPSLVYARDSYGGTALMRALAGLPGLIPVPAGDIVFDPIHADDLGRIVARCLDPGVPARRIYEVGGPQPMSLRDVVVAMRAWLGFAPAPTVAVPAWLMKPALWLGDLAGYLGSPGPLRSTAIIQAAATPPADSTAIVAATGVTPRSFAAAMASEPANAQDRLHARLGFAGPALRIALGLFWLVSGIVVLFPTPFGAARAIAEAAGFGAPLSTFVTAAGALLDIVLGGLMTLGLWTRRVALVQAAVTVVYVATLGILVPILWLDPLGALVKGLVVVGAALAVAAMEEAR